MDKNKLSKMKYTESLRTNFLHRKYPTLYDTGHYIQKYIMTTLFITIYQSCVQLLYFNIHRSLHTYRFSLGNI